MSEALAYKLPFVFVRRDYFNEEPFLRNMLEVETFLSITLFNWHHVMKMASNYVNGISELYKYHDTLSLFCSLQNSIINVALR